MLSPHDLKKGTKVRVKDEIFDTMVLTDSVRSNTRAVESESIMGGTEHGSVYADHITHAWIAGVWVPVQPTKTMLKNAVARKAMGF